MKLIITTLLILFTEIIWAQNLTGKLWSARKVDSVYIVSIQNKSSLVEALTDFVTTQKIYAGQITGIGAINEATLRFFNPGTKQFVDKTFKEQMEVANLSGNISKVEGKTTLHLHVVLGRSDYSALAGHLLDARIKGAGEFFIYPIKSDVVKVKDESIGLNLYNFKEGN